MDLMPHQKQAVEQLSNGKILYAEVGIGKSLTAIAYYAEKDMCGDLYVITTAKKRDSMEWERDAAKYGIGLAEDGVSNLGYLHIDSWNNIAKYEDIEGATFIFDEQRLVGSGKWVQSFYKIARKNHWIILSATPGDTWLDYIPVFVANGFYKNRTEFVRKHVIWEPHVPFPKVRGYINVAKLEMLRDEILVDMEFQKHTTRVVEYVDVKHDAALLKKTSKERWNPYTEAPIKDAAELFATCRKVVYTDRSRLDTIRELLDEHPRMIIFYNFNYELEILRELHDTWSDLLPVAEWNGQNHDPIPEGPRWVYLVQYNAGAEGWNCTSTDTIVFYSMNYSYRRFKQAQGRIDRMNTLYNILHYFVLVSDSFVDRAVLGSLKEKKSFNEKRWMRENPMVDHEWSEDFADFASAAQELIQANSPPVLGSSA